MRFLNTFYELDASMEFSLFVDNMITLLCHLVCLLNVPYGGSLKAKNGDFSGGLAAKTPP